LAAAGIRYRPAAESAALRVCHARPEVDLHGHLPIYKRTRNRGFRQRAAPGPTVHEYLKTPFPAVCHPNLLPGRNTITRADKKRRYHGAEAANARVDTPPQGEVGAH